VTSSLRRRKALWNLADEAGLASAVVGMWATWPPEPLRHGQIVSDHASLARQQEWLDRGKASESAADGTTTWPPGLAVQLAPLQRPARQVTREELAAFVAVDDALWNEFESLDRFSKQVPLSAFRSSHLNDAFHARAAEQIWRESRPDLLVLYLRAVDELSHFFYEAGVPEAAQLGWSDADVRRYAGVVDNAYAWTDRLIAPLVAEALAGGDTLVVLASDHGWAREADGRYNHNDAPPGVLILAGAGVCTEHCPPLRDPTVYDVAPTLLSRLGLPLSAELVGRPLDEAFTAPRHSARVPAYGGRLGPARAVASENDGVLREKLEALGYVRE
jgi:arylsulfatase A-like enzyme